MNNGEVELQRHDVLGESLCYTGVNPFHVKLLKHDKKKEVAKQFGMAKKRAKSPTKNPLTKDEKKKKIRREKSPISSSSRKHGLKELASPTNCKFSVNLGKVSAMKFSPPSKRQRRSPFVEPVNLHSAG